MWINLIFLLISTPYLSRFISINSSDDSNGEEINIMSYNVRLFDKDNLLKIENVYEETMKFANKEEVDIFCIQEYDNPKKYINSNFKYSTIDLEGSKENPHMVIYSNYEIINDTINNGMEDMHNTCIFSRYLVASVPGFCIFCKASEMDLGRQRKGQNRKTKPTN